ncbi:hypothetical protein MNEG_6745 [Monoraphidium neglectum]|uniref:Uncharacterized protein n=1 Tax=Monoraphidium neglectum TaxID=145388 RepID=A0A0D2MDG8_9CHLO|nr:hypothetical protein MNEG_6745 [Monoraphidium neglectum]KIZ01220.1 hypothetical protein MNEG_6745 [Monoraphidium neglectum]|eukprot:XP_013900239.1 hypothetical protein MNEG_6745 [Monoraphidium neglectum]
MQRALVIRHTVLATTGRGFASEAEASPGVIKVVMDLFERHMNSLDRIRAENEAFRKEINGKLDKVNAEMAELRREIRDKKSVKFPWLS